MLKRWIAIIIRDSNEFWLIGYARGLGVSSNFVTKLYALRDGLLMAWNRDLLPLLIEGDSLAIFHILSNPNSIVAHVYNLIEDHRSLM